MISIFISSRERELEPEREVAERTIRALEMEPMRFERDSVPQSIDPRSAYLEGVNKSGMVLLILWKEYSSAVVEEVRHGERNGKDVLWLVKETRNDWNEQRDPQLEDWLKDLRASGFTMGKFRTLEELERLIRQGIALNLERKLRSPFQASGKENLFRTGTGMIEKAQERIILVARTPVPVVGTRPYDEARSALDFELDQAQAFRELIAEASSGKKRSFRCVGSIDAISNLIKRESKTFRFRVKQNLQDCYRKSSIKGSRFELRWIPETNPIHITYLVADDDFIIWLKDGNDDVWIVDANNRIARALEHMSSAMSSRRTLKNALDKLGLP